MVKQQYGNKLGTVKLVEEDGCEFVVVESTIIDGIDQTYECRHGIQAFQFYCSWLDRQEANLGM